MKNSKERLSQTEIWEKHLFYTFIPMVKVYFQRYLMLTYIKFLDKFNDSPTTKNILTKVSFLHFFNEIIKNEGIFRDVISEEQIEELRENCISLNKELRPEIVALTFAIPLIDEAFGAIGKSNLQPYGEFMKGVVNTPGCFGKPKEWKYLYPAKI